ncbi:MAG: homocysteine S-methyltransferase family protein [Glaciecola sp.]
MQHITILDGGMGQELLRRSARPATPMWSADIMLNEPALVKQLHLDFIHAGARVITLNTYTATPSRLTRENHLADLAQLHKSAMQAASDAVEVSGIDEVKIAGCLPPLVASYKSEAALSFARSLTEYRQLVALQNPASDIFICETMSSITEASAACVAAKESGKPVWLALSVKDDNSQQLRSGEALSVALKELAQYQPDAVLLNCSKPEAIDACWPIMQQSNFVLGAYANGFTSVETLFPGDTVEHLQTRKDLTPQAYADKAQGWIEQGATIVGGCCEIGPAHIAQLTKQIV